MSLGEKICNRRKELGFTQEELSEKITAIPRAATELTRQAVSKWERGDTLPDCINLLALSIILDMSLDELCADEIRYMKGVIEGDPCITEKYPGLITGMKVMMEVFKNL